MGDDLRERQAALEAEMKVLEANLEKALAEFRADVARGEARQAERDARNFQWTVGLVVAAVVVMGIIGIFAG